jgi:phage pi2 protein 07
MHKRDYTELKDKSYIKEKHSDFKKSYSDSSQWYSANQIKCSKIKDININSRE